MLVKGYKGMRSDMTCRGMQYEIGKTYHAEGTVELCRNGFHFCKKLTDVFDFYGRENGNRFFEVEAEEVDNDGAKSVASSIRIIRELSVIQVNRAFEPLGDGYYGDGHGYYGDGHGNYGDGHGDGYGDGYYGYGNGYYGDGNGDGNGNGNGDGDVNGDGNGNGYGTQKIMIFE